MRAIMDNAGAAIYMKDMDGRYIHANRVFEEWFHLKPEAIQGKTDYDIFPPEIAEAFVKNDRLVLQAGRLQEMEEKILRDNCMYTCLSAKFPLRTASGETYAFCGISTDITEVKRAGDVVKASETKYRTLFENSRFALMTIAPPSWNFTSGNAAAVELFRLNNEEEFTGCMPWVLPPERQPDGYASAEKAREMIETAKREGSCFFDWTHRRIDGEEFPATVLLTRVEQPE